VSASIARLKVLSAGILSLILMLGIARFAYTPMLPIMQQQAGLGIAEGGWLAAINYIGYLCGAIIASRINSLVLKDQLYRLGLVVAIVTTVIMGLTEDFWLWSISRFFAGLSSAAGLLLGSGLILNWLIRNDYRSELGIHFSGLGLGIAICALIVALMDSYLNWREQWFLLTALGIVILFPAWIWLPCLDTSNLTQSGQALKDSPPSRTFIRLFMAAYFCAGMGYVISATFIVAIVEQLPGLEISGSWAFMLLGLAAAPACIVWDLIARRMGDFNALLSAFLLQIVGILCSMVEGSFALAIAGAMLFGGTFIGIVSLVLTIAGRYYPTRPAKMMGKLTSAYGIAQIIGPAIAGTLAEASGNYHGGLAMAVGAMLVGTLLIIKLRAMQKTT
jgi:predicted MFS family arabinose efflux permease